IRNRFPHRTIPEKAVIKQALIPSSAKIVPNDVGTAPGIIFEEKSKIVILLPGVPREMKKMMDERIVPYLAAKTKNREIVKSKVLRIYGMGESQVEEKISSTVSHYTNPTVAFL
ncbi:competence/damage-inducible protein A, partial [bacterium]|nr:competence/damage-inducible protein A [bacterium]NIO73852.1 competence/damage-inducible protein A [bacterium]